MRTLQLVFHSDPGHGWLQVPKTLLDELELRDRISPYSYMDSQSAYLEEDCDYAVFAEALTKAGMAFEYREVHQDPSPIRGLMPYRA